MGYTHSWIRPRELDRIRFAEAAENCRSVCEASGVELHGIEGHAAPCFEPYLVAFDGGCEWFVVQCICDSSSAERPARSAPGKHFGFCKTRQMPYDLCVKACLIAFEHHFPGEFAVSSDGDDLEWQQARELCQRVVGYGASFRLAQD